MTLPRRPGRRVTLLLALAALVWLAPTPPAVAGWSGAGTGSGAGRATTLAPVGSVSAVCAGGPVTVSWAPVPPATAYSVWRSDNLGPWTMVRASSAATSFTDSSTSTMSLSARWAVVASRNAWNAPQSAASASRTIALGICL